MDETHHDHGDHHGTSETPSFLWTHSLMIILTLVIHLPLLAWYVSRKTLYPLKERNHFLIISSILLWTIFSLNEHLAQVLRDVWTCGALIYVRFFCFFGFGAVVILRCVLLVQRFRESQRVALAAILEITPDDYSVQHTYSRSAMYHYGSLAVLSGIHVLPPAIFFSLHPEIGSNTIAEADCDHDTLYLGYVITGYMGLYTIAVLASYYGLKDVRENFYIKKEFRGLIVVGISCAIEAGIRSTSHLVVSGSSPLHDSIGRISTFFYSVLGLLIVSISLIVPTHKTYKVMRATESNQSVRSDQNLKDVLDDNGRKEEFRDFLVSEFSAENLLFYDIVEKFRKGTENGRIEEEAVFIFDKLIREGGEYQVNIGENDRVTLEKLLASDKTQIDRNSFDRAQEEIFDLMNNDPFVRFRYQRKQ